MASGWSMPTGSLDRWPEDYERGRPVSSLTGCRADGSLNQHGPNPGGQSYLFDGLASVAALTNSSGT